MNLRLLDMPEQVLCLPFHDRASSRILQPVAGWTLLVTLIAAVYRAMRQPSLPRMSKRWLASRQLEFCRSEY